MIFARFPNGDSPLSMPFQNGDLTHVESIGSEKAKQIFNAAGFNIVNIFDPPEPLWDGRLAQSIHRSIFWPIKKVISWIVQFIYFPGRNYSIFSPNICLIAKKVDESN